MDNQDSQAQTKIINLDILNKLRSDMGDDSGELIAELADMFFGDAADLLADIKTALQTDNRELFVRASHTLKSSAAMLGMQNLANLAEELESGAKSGIIVQLAPLVQKAEESFDIAVSQLREVRATLPGA